MYEAAALLRLLDVPVRWVAADALHLTLQFLGRVADDAVAEIEAALARAAAEVAPFHAQVGGVGAFPTFARARVIWIAVEPATPLLALQQRVASELAPLGFVPEERPYAPHVTLGRARQGARAAELAGLAAAAARVDYRGTLRAGHVDLMQSTPSPAGARYDVRAALPLGSGPQDVIAC